MSFELASLAAAVAAHGRVCRVVVAATSGSAPREPGAAMLVWESGQSGTIGGGALELEALRRARRLLSARHGGGGDGGNGARLWRLALGPALGQCCGGAVRLLAEPFDARALEGLEGLAFFARPADAGAGSGREAIMPLALRRLLRAARAGGPPPAPQLIEGWMVEPLTPPRTPVWIYGAGHVGRALAHVIAPLPEFAITWVDTGPGRFPDPVPAGVTALPARAPARAAVRAPASAHHLILTYSHALDLDLCHALLGRPAASIGLIGSASKWARFRNRLAALGHSPERIGRIACPIGAPALGKHPQAIALGVARDLLDLHRRQECQITNREKPDDRPARREDRASCA